MATSLVGVVLRENAVEVVQLSRGWGGLRVARSARIGLARETAQGAPVGSDPQTRAQENAEIAKAIRTAMSTAGIVAKRVIVALTPQDVLLRAFSIPAIPRSEVDAAVQYEARKYLPFKLNELVWDYVVVPPADKQITVIFAAAERAALLRVREWLKGAGLEAACIEPYSLSLARAIARSRNARPREVIAAVDLHGDSAHIAIAKDGLVYLARDVQLDAGDLQAARLVSELRLSLDFFARGFAGHPVSRVVVFGDPAVVTRVTQACSGQLGCPVEAGLLSIHAGPLGVGAIPFAAAIGAAQRAGARGGPFDFLRRSSQAASSAPQPAASMGHPALDRASALLASLNRPVLGLFGLAAAALVVSVWLVGARQLAVERQRLAQVIHHRPDVGFGLTGRSQDDLALVRQTLEEQLAFLRRVIQDRMPVSSKLDALARVLPSGIWLTSLSYQDELSAAEAGQAVLNIQGACFLGEEGSELSTIRQFEEAMKRDPVFFQGFSTSRLQEISVQSDQRQRYTYRTFQMKYDTERNL